MAKRKSVNRPTVRKPKVPKLGRRGRPKAMKTTFDSAAVTEALIALSTQVNIMRAELQSVARAVGAPVAAAVVTDNGQGPLIDADVDDADDLFKVGDNAAEAD